MLMRELNSHSEERKMGMERHNQTPVSLAWQPHAGDRETRTGAFAPAHKEKQKGGIWHERERDAGRESV